MANVSHETFYCYELPEGRHPSSGKPQQPGWYWQYRLLAHGGHGPFKSEREAQEHAREKAV